MLFIQGEVTGTGRIIAKLYLVTIFIFNENSFVRQQKKDRDEESQSWDREKEKWLWLPRYSRLYARCTFSSWITDTMKF